MELHVGLEYNSGYNNCFINRMRGRAKQKMEFWINIVMGDFVKDEFKPIILDCTIIAQKQRTQKKSKDASFTFPRCF